MSQDIAPSATAPMTASDFRLLTESEKYGLYAEAARSHVAPPHGCGDSGDHMLCHMDLDGTCPLKTCSYYAPPANVAPFEAPDDLYRNTTMQGGEVPAAAQSSIAESVTPEMIAAGKKALDDYFSGGKEGEADDGSFVAVYRAMQAAAPPSAIEDRKSRWVLRTGSTQWETCEEYTQAEVIKHFDNARIVRRIDAATESRGANG